MGKLSVIPNGECFLRSEQDWDRFKMFGAIATKGVVIASKGNETLRSILDVDHLNNLISSLNKPSGVRKTAPSAGVTARSRRRSDFLSWRSSTFSQVSLRSELTFFEDRLRLARPRLQ